jgi:hypothetical protein
MYYAVKMARAIVLYYAPEFATGDNFLSPPAETDKSEFEINLWREAASFLLAHGIINIDDQEETDVAYGRVSPVPDENGEFPVHVQLPKCLCSWIELTSILGDCAARMPCSQIDPIERIMPRRHLDIRLKHLQEDADAQYEMHRA